MMLITGPLWSGKRAFACRVLGCTPEELSSRAVWDAQDLAAARADCVVRVLCGLPLVLKGECAL